MNDVIGLRLPDFLYEAVAADAARSGNSLQAIVRLRLAEYYGDAIEKEAAVKQQDETELVEAQ